ncbi:MAG: hypothetical protein NTW50_02630 [Candidatus Berkelbacteria bacterium]|nr:hypothetical protein [Candidatus Berkelbacteria bacterium]
MESSFEEFEVGPWDELNDSNDELTIFFILLVSIGLFLTFVVRFC